MKAYQLLMTIIIIVAALIVTETGCKYEVADPKWDSPPVSSTTVTITGIVPSQATPGVNVITILGTNLEGALDTNRTTKHYYYTDSLNVPRDTIVYDTTLVYNGVYFDNVQATILEISPTMIKVYRPNIVSNSCTIKIASDKALATVKYTPYRIDAVTESFCSFVGNPPLGSICVGNGGFIYVTETTNKYLWKVAPDGSKTQLLAGNATNLVLTRVPTDARIGPGGNLYYFNNVSTGAKEIHMVVLSPASSVKDSLWFTFSPVKNVICGDFDKNGYLYTGGRKSGVQVIRPDRSRRDEGGYANDTITSMRVFNDYLYLATGKGVWRHSILDTSKLGAQELVLDKTKGILTGYSIKAFSFSQDGTKMYFGSDTQYPIVIAEDANSIPIPANKLDYLYRGITASNCKNFCFENFLYTILGNVVYKIDVGTTSAPYYH
jgi:hypothetical protein